MVGLGGGLGLGPGWWARSRGGARVVGSVGGPGGGLGFVAPSVGSVVGLGVDSGWWAWVVDSGSWPPLVGSGGGPGSWASVDGDGWWARWWPGSDPFAWDANICMAGGRRGPARLETCMGCKKSASMGLGGRSGVQNLHRTQEAEV